MSDTREKAADRTVFVGNLETRVREEILYELFLQAGPLTRVTICKDKEGRPRPFGFVCFKHQESVSYAIALLNGIRLYGRPINVQYRFGSSHSAELNNQVAENYINTNSQIYRNEDFLSRSFPIQTFTANDGNFTQEFGSQNMQYPMYNLMVQPSKCQMTPPLASSFSVLSMPNPLSDLDARSTSFEFVHQPSDWNFCPVSKRKWQPETSDSSTEDDIGKVRECNKKYRRYKKRKRN
ncbi:splicing regulator RBM11 [Phascolarctos cinereus]|uniref:Splicing regulator RBM11 n=1 Tax=Phascolarctos cinereus TaxID=38626 RepID=A0A6P5KSB2_PHACI|nr:splicing regulator RBM11 isoform X1 [Phascolarctos cinereus]